MTSRGRIASDQSVTPNEARLTRRIGQKPPARHERIRLQDQTALATREPLKTLKCVKRARVGARRYARGDAACGLVDAATHSSRSRDRWTNDDDRHGPSCRAQVRGHSLRRYAGQPGSPILESLPGPLMKDAAVQSSCFDIDRLRHGASAEPVSRAILVCTSSLGCRASRQRTASPGHIGSANVGLSRATSRTMSSATAAAFSFEVAHVP